MTAVQIRNTENKLITWYQSDVVPRVNENIYSADNGKTYSVISVLHSVGNEKISNIVVTVEEKNEQQT